MKNLKIKPARGVQGSIRVPGDKSISHRAAILSSLAGNTTEIYNYSQAADCHSTLECLKGLGAQIENTGKSVVIRGGGKTALREPGDVLYAGNSGTTMRLLCGLLASLPFFAVLNGDSSLRARPMDRIIVPLARMGASIGGRVDNTRPPLAVKGNQLRGIDYESPVASAQVKSAVLLAALQAKGRTSFTEPSQSRDHTERMLEHFGVAVTRQDRTVTVHGPCNLFSAGNFTVPGDISSAAFFMVAASIIPGSDIIIRDLGVNPSRTGIVDALKKMGADISVHNKKEECGEPAADIRIRHAPLKGITIDGDTVPRLIDEIPVLAVAAARAKGKTVITGAGELKYKETNRIQAVVSELKKLGIQVQELEDGLEIEGDNKIEGGKCQSWGDHRMAMALAVAGLASRKETEIEEAGCIDISFPGFIDVLKSITEE